MRKLLFIVVLSALGLSSISAQEETTGGFKKGDIYLGGSIGYRSFKRGDIKTNDVKFSPSAGYFLSDNVALEFGLTLGALKNTNDNKTNTYGGQLGGVYFFTPAKQFSFTLRGSLFYQSSTIRPSSGDPRSTINIYGFVASPGINYFISDRISLRGSIGALSYARSKNDAAGAEATDDFNINLDLSDLNFGIVYKF